MTCEANRVADALEACDWTKPSIGNKAILQKAAELLRRQQIALKTARNDALEEAAEVADKLAAKQDATNEKYVDHVKAYPVWLNYPWKCREVSAAIRALADKPAPTADTGQVVTCYECGGPLKGPYCPECAPLDVERVREDRDFWKSSFQTETRARIELQERLTDVAASLVAAVSLLKRGSKKAAPSDKMFDQMIADYEGSIERARAALRKQEAGE